MPYLPVKNIGQQMDFVLISADAYVDHPSFGHAIISRVVENMGFSIGIIPQPVKDIDYREFGEPKHGFLISGGVVDSMVNNYTVALKRREKDEYSEGGIAGRRPDRALTVYSKAVRRIFPDTSIIIGGVEASLRRFAHYDYWANKVMPSILIDSQADLLIYGMGERPVMDILNLVIKGVPIKNIKDFRGTAYKSSYDNLSNRIKDMMSAGEVKFCASYEDVRSNNINYVKAFNLQNNTNNTIAQKSGKEYIIANPQGLPLSVKEMDNVYNLPYMRSYHPMYTKGVPAIEEVKFSITSHRGCFGGCNYCSINYHQGRLIQKRSKESIIKEAQLFTEDKDFKGYIHDVGGPTANFRNVACNTQEDGKACGDKPCIGHNPCKNLRVDHREYIEILRELRAIEGIKRVFIRSGIRYDYLMYDKSDEFLNEIVKYHVSGQLKVAPEHCSESVLSLMNKPRFNLYKEFKKKFMEATARANKEQYLVPYFISSHPGATLDDAIAMALYLKSEGYTPEQVQDFYPTPSTKSTTMYYTGINPDTMQEIYVPRTKEEKSMQRALLQYRLPKNHSLVKAALEKAGRHDLIGNTPKCLIKPYKDNSRHTGNRAGK